MNKVMTVTEGLTTLQIPIDFSHRNVKKCK